MSAAPRPALALTAWLTLAPVVLPQTYPTPPPPARPGVVTDAPAPGGGPPRQLATSGPAVGTYTNNYSPPPPRAPAVAPVAPLPAYVSGGLGSNLGMLGAGPGVGYGTALQGLGSYTQAQGQYWNDIEQARMGREDVKQKQIETQRQEVQWEMDYEKLRPTTQKMVRSERTAELEWARNNPPQTEIWSGKTFNVLLRSILDSPNPTGGPNIPLDPPVVRAINLTDGTTRANLSLAKDEGKIDWPEILLEKPFDEYRNGFQKDFDKGLQSINSGTPLNRDQLRELRSELDGLSNKLDDMIRDMTPSQHIGATRLLNQLKETVNGMGNARVVRSAGQSWKRDVRAVSQLVNHCLKNGLQFGPAVASEDEPYYIAAYYAIRNYERGLVGDATGGKAR